MPRIQYQEIKFKKTSLRVIGQANEIIDEYARQGFDLTLRQLYYQFVSRDLLKNNQKEYKRLGSVVNDARLAGLIDWDRITDRTRNLEGNSHWRDPADIIDSCVKSFQIDKWADQPHRVEVWIEKEALAGVFERICRELDVSWFCCRGYTSQSEMWAAGRRLQAYRRKNKQEPIVLHFGDHDPSGMDMSRDITDRLALFAGGAIEIRRLALNMDQVEEYSPPPNPAKMSDSRATGYVDEFGDESWELDALDPTTLAALVRDEIETIRDQALWDAQVEEEAEHVRKLREVSDQWDSLTGDL